jgi:hypothetical protein
MGSSGTAWSAAALPFGLVALAPVAVAARSTGKVSVGFAAAGLTLGIAALVILMSARLPE